MDAEDPIAQFFPGEEDVDLYKVLSLTSEAKVEEIKKAYRKLALIYHPDKHASSSEQEKKDASIKFQQVGFAYAVLSDEKRRTRYDRSGKTDEGFELAEGEDGWETYFADLFDQVTKGKLDELKKEYQGSEEEVQDVKQAYLDSKGSLEEIMNHIPHSTHDDEDRFVLLISKLIKQDDIPSFKEWERSSKDDKAKMVRKKQADKEAKEAEELAKELGVWDEFYGSGKAGARKAKGKNKVAKGADEEEEDHSALQALILGKQKKMNSFFDSLAEKYADADSPPKSKSRKGKKRGSDDEEPVEKRSGKRSKNTEPPEIDDEEFRKLQDKLFGDKDKADKTKSTSKAGKAGKGRRAKAT